MIAGGMGDGASRRRARLQERLTQALPRFLEPGERPVTGGLAIVHLRPLLITAVIVGVIALAGGAAGAAAADADPPNTALALAILAVLIVGGPLVVILVLARALRWAVLTDRRVLLLRATFRSARPTSLDRADPRDGVTILPARGRASIWPTVIYRTPDGGEQRLRFQPIWLEEATAFRETLTSPPPPPPPPMPS